MIVRTVPMNAPCQPELPSLASPEYVVHEGDGLLRGKRSIRGSFPTRREAREAAQRLVREGARMVEVRQGWGLLDTYVGGEMPQHLYAAPGEKP